MRSARRAVTIGSILVGLWLVLWGYVFHSTTLVVRTDLAGGPAGPSAEVPPKDVELPPDDDWGEENGEDDATLDELAKELEADSGNSDGPTDDDWDDEIALPDEWKEGLAAAPAGSPAQEETMVVTESALVRGAVMGIIVRLTDGRLGLTYVGDGSSGAPSCYT